MQVSLSNSCNVVLNGTKPDQATVNEDHIEPALPSSAAFLLPTVGISNDEVPWPLDESSSLRRSVVCWCLCWCRCWCWCLSSATTSVSPRDSCANLCGKSNMKTICPWSSLKYALLEYFGLHLHLPAVALCSKHGFEIDMTHDWFIYFTNFTLTNLSIWCQWCRPEIEDAVFLPAKSFTNCLSPSTAAPGSHPETGRTGFSEIVTPREWHVPGNPIKLIILVPLETGKTQNWDFDSKNNFKHV